MVHLLNKRADNIEAYQLGVNRSEVKEAGEWQAWLFIINICLLIILRRTKQLSHIGMDDYTKVNKFPYIAFIHDIAG
ncbi:MAG: hypothetical protein WAZ77_06540 [Candidatus Nitrosopolaris sp.]|jgi:hypothetical protein